MVVAVDTRGTPLYKKFILESFKIITAQYPDHSFIFIAHQSLDPYFIFPENVTQVLVKQTKIPLLQQVKISSLLKKHKAGVFVTSQVLNTKIPQFLIVIDKLSPKSFRKAKVIVTTSLSSKKEIAEKYKIEENKINVVYHGVDEKFQPVKYEEKEKIKERYAEGNEYFLFYGDDQSTDTLLKLLKAFSVFKKMQKSSMQLLIVSKQNLSKEFLKEFDLYKFKDHVKVVKNIEVTELPQITGAAYALISFSAGYTEVLEGMRYDIPVIAANEDVIEEVCGDAALYFNNNNYKDIADKMMMVYKDENLRQQLIDKGKEKVKKYPWKNSAASLWKSIEKAGG